MKDKVVSLSILSKKTDIFPLIYIMLNLRLLNWERLESSAFGSNEESCEPYKFDLQGYILALFKGSYTWGSDRFLLLRLLLAIDTKLVLLCLLLIAASKCTPAIFLDLRSQLLLTFDRFYQYLLVLVIETDPDVLVLHQVRVVKVRDNHSVTPRFELFIKPWHRHLNARLLSVGLEDSPRLVIHFIGVKQENCFLLRGVLDYLCDQKVLVGLFRRDTACDATLLSH